MSVPPDRLRDKRPAYYPIYKRDFALFAKIPAKQRPYAIAAYNVICYHANNQTDTAFPSYNTIAELSGMSRRMAMEAVRLLAEVGMLTVMARHKEGTNEPTSNLYTLIAAEVVHDVHQVVQDSDHLVHSVHHPPGEVVHTVHPNKHIKIEQDEDNEMWIQLKMMGIPDRPSYIRLVGRGLFDDPIQTVEFARRKLAEKQRRA